MYKLSEAAATDIETILEKSIIDFGLRQTELYYHSLKNCLGLLGENKQMGIGADDVQSGYYRFPHESHVIFYKISDDDIFIVRILHKRMDIENQMIE